jgi:hypothetical protein
MYGRRNSGKWSHGYMDALPVDRLGVAGHRLQDGAMTTYSIIWLGQIGDLAIRQCSTFILLHCHLHTAT